MKIELIELLKQNNIQNDELNKILSYVEEEPIFFSQEKRLLSLAEILNYKEEVDTELNIIPLVDCYDNNFLVYNLEENQFQIIDVSDDFIWNRLESISDYLNLLEKE